MTSFNVMFKMFEPYFRPETKKARSSINKTAGNREAYSISINHAHKKLLEMVNEIIEF